MRRALHALLTMVASGAVLAAAGALFYERYPFSVYDNDMRNRRDYVLEVREVRRDETSSLVTLTITPEISRPPDWAVTYICFFAHARGKSYFTMSMQSAAPDTYIVEFPESMNATLTSRAGEPSKLVRAVKICEPVVTR